MWDTYLHGEELMVVSNSLTVPGFPIRFPPPMRFPVQVKATENDPTMKIAVSGFDVSINGNASNSGFVASRATFEVPGKTITIPLGSGETPAQVLAALRKRLPDG